MLTKLTLVIWVVALTIGLFVSTVVIGQTLMRGRWFGPRD